MAPDPAQQRVIADVEMPSSLGPDAEFEGRIHVLSSARLDGRVQGEITAGETLWIGPEAEIRASVSAREIIVEGHLEGDLRATQRIEIRSTARIAGDVFTPGLELREGAIVCGRCRMSRPEHD